MRAHRVAIVLVALVIFGGTGPAARAESDWVGQAGLGAIVPAGDSGLDPGFSVSIFLARPVRPALLVGAEASWITLVPRNGYSFYFGPSPTTDDTHIATLTAMLRVQPPVHAGPAPFMAVEAGVARARTGDRHASRVPFGSGDGVSRGAVEWGSRLSAALGVRMVVPGGWPDLELSVRGSRLGFERSLTFAELRAALAF